MASELHANCMDFINQHPILKFILSGIILIQIILVAAILIMFFRDKNEQPNKEGF